MPASQPIEESDLIRVGRVGFGLVIAQAHQSVLPFPTLRLVAKLAFKVRVRLGRTPPIRRLQFTQQPVRLPSHDDKLAVQFGIGIHRVPAVEARVGSGSECLDRLGQSLDRPSSDRHSGKSPCRTPSPRELISPITR